MPAQRPWYALHVPRNNYQIAVATKLRQLGIEEYLPIHRVSRASQRKRFAAGHPLFPGYMFS